jgi:hypothetical protein
MMALLTRRARPPAPAATWLEPDERLVSFADAAGGQTVMATSRGLWWPVPHPRRLGWHLIDKAVWRDGVLAVTEAEVVDDLLLVDRHPVALALDVPRDLPPTVRKRVQSTVIRSELAAVPGGAARFVGRRVPGRDGVAWWARLEPGTPDDPVVRDAVAQRLEALRSAWAAAG